MRRAWLVAMLSLCGARALVAQSTKPDAAPLSVSRSVAAAIGRAQGLMESGDATGARVLLDSLVTNADPLSLDAAEALHWRAVLAERAADGERDWRRLVIDIPLSPRVPEALLRLADMDLVRGRPAAAREEYQRLLSDFPESASRQVASLGIARSYFEERNVAGGCRALDSLRGVEIPEGELRLQSDELQRRCTSAMATSAMGVAEKPVAAGKPAPSRKSPAGSGRYSVQLAAYDTRAEANDAVQRFQRRDINTRIDGEQKPFRVRVGYYATRVAATKALGRLKKIGVKGFVVERAP